MDTSTLLLTAKFFSQEKKKLMAFRMIWNVHNNLWWYLNKNENIRAIQMEFLKEKVYIFWKLMEMLVMEVWQAWSSDEIISKKIIRLNALPNQSWANNISQYLVQGPQPAPHPYPPASSLTKPRKDIHRGKMNASKIPHSYTLIPIEIWNTILGAW